MNDLSKSSRPQKILIVDDYKSMRAIICKLLFKLGYKDVDEAKDGNQALDRLSKEPFDLVITDWNMAPMPGCELVSQIRSDGKLKNVPVIMITAEEKTEYQTIAEQAGADAYIVKPFTAEFLDEKISEAIERRNGASSEGIAEAETEEEEEDVWVID